MNQNEEVSLGAESGCPDDQVTDGNTTLATSSKEILEIVNDRPEMYSSKKGGFTCRYYYHVERPEEVDNLEFVRIDRMRI